MFVKVTTLTLLVRLIGAMAVGTGATRVITEVAHRSASQVTDEAAVTLARRPTAGGILGEPGEIHRADWQRPGGHDPERHRRRGARWRWRWSWR